MPLDRKLMRGFIFAILLAALPGAAPARADWLSLLRGSMLFNEGEFDPSVNYHGGCPAAVAFADFDGDGHQDMVIANRNTTTNKPSLYGNSVSVLLHTNPAVPYPGFGFWGGSPVSGPIPVLQDPTNFTAGTLPLNVGAADFTGDGRPDIVVAGGGLTLLVNTGLPGAARFAPPKGYSMAGTFGAMHVGDVNGDGTPEVVVPYGSEAVKTYRGSGDSLILVGTSTVPVFRDPIVVTDLTGDGYKDLVVYNVLSGSDCDTNPWSQVYVVPGDSQGLFTGAVQGPFSSPIVSESSKSGLISASLNGDPYPEMIGVSECAPKLWISQGLAGGQLAAPFSITLPHTPTTVCAGDIDGDGDVDLVTTQYFTGNTPTSSVCVIRNNGNLTFAAPTLSPGASRAWASVLSDVNEDGRLDLVTPQTGTYDWFAGSEFYNHAVEVLWNDGAGGFLAPAVSELGAQCYRQVAGDFNRDGFPDLATSSSGEVRIGLGNGTGTFTPGSSLMAGLPTTLVTGDTDRDGKLDLLVNNSGSAQHWRGNGDGTFVLQQTYAFTIFPRSLIEMTRDAVLDAIAYDGSGLSVRAGLSGGALTGTTIAIGAPSVGVTAVQPGDWNRDGLIDVAVAGPGGLSVYLRSAAFTFGSEAVLKTGRAYTDVCTGDFNRDGILDLAARESGTALPLNRGIDVFLGTGSGTFGSSTSYGTLDPKGSTVETWDANLDGITDLITSSQVNNSPSASADIFLGNGMGEFGLRTSYGLGPVDQDGTNPFMAAADIDRNGVPDVVSGRSWTASPQHTYVQTLLATPPSFTATRQDAQFYPTISAPYDLAVGDLDRDGKLDVVTATVQTSPGIAVHRGTGGGKIGPATTLAQSWNANRVRLGDLNRDGILDIIGANFAAGSRRVFTMLGNGNMTFGARTDYAVNAGNDMEVGDMNRDGILDVVVATADSIRLLLGTPIGGFMSFGNVSVGGTIYDIDLADLNRDGVLDVVCAKGNVVVLYSFLNGTLGSPVLLTTPVSVSEHVCVADMNRDGFPDIVVNQSDSYYVVWGAATSPFSTYQHTQLPWGTYDLHVAPMAANGIPYLMVAHNVQWLEIVSVSPSGVLAPAGGYQIGTNPLSMALGDMDRDGLLDVLSINTDNTVAINLRGAGTITAVETTSPAPRSARLDQNFPNPFNPSTTIRFTLPEKGRARLTVHDVRGRLVAVLADRELPRGEHSVPWHGTDAGGRTVSSGVYFYRLVTEEGASQSKRMVVLK